MIELNNFAEFLFKSILEGSQGSNELPVYFSDAFKNILQDIIDETGNEVAQRLLYEEGKEDKRVFIDVDQDSNDKVSFLMANKVEDILNRRDRIKYLDVEEHDKIYKARQRGTMKINRFVNDLFNNEYQTKPLTPEQRELYKEKGLKTPAQHLEDFVNQYKAIREPGEFELVKGNDIMYYYNEEQYESDLGTLGNSCMMYDECASYINFYSINTDKVSLLIMKSKESENSDKIIGRALVWNLDQPSGRTYMDRIYTSKDHDVENFKKYAKDKGWLYKFKQNMEADEKIVDTVNNITEFITLVVKGMNIPDPDNPAFPYLDTLKYYSPTLKTLTNNQKILQESGDGIIYVLSGTEGTDYYKISTRTIDELREMYKEEILDDIKYYAVEMYPDMFWNFIDDNMYVQSFIDSEVDYYLEDFEHIFEDEDELIKLIKNNVNDESKLPKNLEELDIDELQELTDKLNIRGEIAREYAEERYKDYSAKDIYEELYGIRNGIDNDIFDQLKYHFNEDEFAEEVANMEDEEYLRSRYPDDEDY
jgi:hypothetical protein